MRLASHPVTHNQLFWACILGTFAAQVAGREKVELVHFDSEPFRRYPPPLKKHKLVMHGSAARDARVKLQRWLAEGLQSLSFKEAIPIFCCMGPAESRTASVFPMHWYATVSFNRGPPVRTMSLCQRCRHASPDQYVPNLHER